MAYSEPLAERVRLYFLDHYFYQVEEKRMMGGLTFMLNGKMCVGVYKDNLMCRIDPAEHLLAIEENGCKAMEFNNKALHGYVLIEQEALHKIETFAYWMQKSIAFNPQAKASKKE